MSDDTNEAKLSAIVASQVAPAGPIAAVPSGVAHLIGKIWRMQAFVELPPIEQEKQMSSAEDLAEWLVTMHNDALARGEDHGKLLDRVDGWARGHLVRFRGDPTIVAYEQKLLALTFEERGLLALT
jgi:hypothetical protein